MIHASSQESGNTVDVSPFDTIAEEKAQQVLYPSHLYVVSAIKCNLAG